jgi:bifunctional UDP-N-acetylglucosamine pyrophosphorylase/glucosamine-1-phosphate N-acetyltransferase
MNDLACIILAAGEGTRMKSSLPKVMHPLLGVPMIFHVLRSVMHFGDIPTVIVTGHESDMLKREIARSFPSKHIRFALQRKRLGTADAVKAGLTEVPSRCRNVVVLMGDMPLISAGTIGRIIFEHTRFNSAITVGTATLENPSGYGRVIRSFSGRIIGIREERDCSQDEKKIKEINTGVYCFSLPFIRSYIKNIKNDNTTREFYLTDIVKISASVPSAHIGTLGIPAEEARGINDRIEVAEAENLLLSRVRMGLMQSGVSMILPKTTYIEASVKISPDTILDPSVVIRGETVIGKGCRIGAGCVITDAIIEDGATIHPHCVIVKSVVRRNTQVGPFAKVLEGSGPGAGREGGQPRRDQQPPPREGLEGQPPEPPAGRRRRKGHKRRRRRAPHQTGQVPRGPV